MVSAYWLALHMSVRMILVKYLSRNALKLTTKILKMTPMKQNNRIRRFADVN